MAQELGLFEKHGVEVKLSREVGWATIRDKVLYGELDAAHAIAGLVFSCTLGLNCVARDCVTALVLNLHGNAITLSNELRARGVRDGESLAQEVARLRGRRMLTFGVTSPFSTHHFLLRTWLRRAGLDPECDVEIVNVPPPQMHGNLREGNLDGYCVGEPWNSTAVMHRIGWCVATSGELAPRHPEKVLLVRRDFAEERAGEHLALVAALIEACRFCDRPENRERIIETLALPAYVGAPIQALRMSMAGTFNFGHGRVEKDRDFHIFSRDGANEPSAEAGAWVLRQLGECGLLVQDEVPEDAVARGFRLDLYRDAERLLS